MQKKYNTKNKGIIMEFVESHQDVSFTAADVFNYIKAKSEIVNQTTVYRNLDKLTDEGLIKKFKTTRDDSYKYQYAGENMHCSEHIHMQCTKCGRMFHLECDFMKEISCHLEKHHGFKIDCGTSVLNGLCKSCADKEATI